MKKKHMILALALGLSLSVVSCQKNDSMSSWELLKDLILIPGVSGHEGQVADFVQSHFPSGVESQRDDMENVWFTVGEGHPHLLFVAHTDEIGLVVEKITPEGTLKVRGRGGFISTMYEGRPVVIYTEKGPINGVVAPRPEYFSREAASKPFRTSDFEIYLGVSSEEEARSLGIKEGNQITIKKKIVEFSPDLIATRAVDDRAGCAALLAAASGIDWTKIKGKTITFAWDVQEEIGLFGASHLAQTLKPDYVFAVDTFVSSDAPLDSKRFARTALGEGAVLRAIDSSNIAPRFELEKVMKIAQNHNIPFQLGNTRGGNDGSVFVPGGATDIPLSWPGVYSHSFIEKIHRHDLEALTELVVAIVRDWE
ncbi:MAG: M28 family peptidase [Candidatus Aminicenantes bacterium]|jgi:putative aminopeptidase FrvX